MAAELPPSAEEGDHAFWQVCHGGQRRTAERLLAVGADVNAAPHRAKHTPLAVASGPDARRDTLVLWLRDRGVETTEELTAE